MELVLHRFLDVLPMTADKAIIRVRLPSSSSLLSSVSSETQSLNVNPFRTSFTIFFSSFKFFMYLEGLLVMLSNQCLIISMKDKIEEEKPGRKRVVCLFAFR